MPNRTPEEIVAAFVASGYVPMPNIPGNRTWETDSTISTLVWVEANVVIEEYLLKPSRVVPLHSHPFDNQLIFVSGTLIARRALLEDTVVYKKGMPVGPNTPKKTLPKGTIIDRTFTNEDANFVSTPTPSGEQHGFETGPDGAMIYNVQIWPDTLPEGGALSAAIKYIGETMGPMHDGLLAQHA